MKTKIYRGIVIGCGQIGARMEGDAKRTKPATHAGALVINKRTTLVALVDRNPQNLAAAAKLFPKARCYTSLEECLKTEMPDIAIIATGPVGRFATIRACLDVSVPMIICEKPIATTLAEARRLREALKKSAAVFVVNYQRRFFSLMRTLRDDLRAGKFGAVQQVTGYYTNGLYNNGGHLVDSLHHLLGERVISSLARRNIRNATTVAGDANVDALLTTAGGTVIALQSLDKSKWSIHELRFYTEKGCVVLGDYGQSVTFIPVGKSAQGGSDKLDLQKAKTRFKKESMVAGALAHAVDCYEKQLEPESSMVTALETLETLDLIARSAAKRSVAT